MANKMSLPMAIAIVVVAVGVLGFAAYRFFAGESVPRDAKGNPTRVGPPEAQGGVKAMQGLWQNNQAMPNRPAPPAQPR
jgi:hypothetical protein